MKMAPTQRNSRPFRLLAVADNRKFLRRLCRFLGGFGFQVDPIADPQAALAIRQSAPPDFLIVDPDNLSTEHSRKLLSKNREGHTYTFLMVHDLTPETLTEALTAGVDDFLAKPLVYGELLARLRAGARILEHGRRIEAQAAIDHSTKLLNESAFRARVAGELDRLDGRSVSCILIELDFFSVISRSYGLPVGEEVLRNIAAHIRSLSAGKCKYLAAFGGGRFAALLADSADCSDSADSSALAWSETVRESIAAVETQVADQTISVTASLGVAGSMEGPTSASEMIQLAEDALRTAKSSGCNCVARSGQFESETREWEDLARRGRLFETTVARDVMMPCPQFLQPEQTLEQAAETFHKSRLDELPVVDHHGRILGLLGSTRTQDDGTSSNQRDATVGDLMDTNIKTVPENEPFTKLMEFFMDDAPAHHVALVVRQDRPLGIVYRSGLAALSEPLTLASFAPDQPYSLSSDYLIVRETGAVATAFD